MTMVSESRKLILNKMTSPPFRTTRDGAQMTRVISVLNVQGRKEKGGVPDKFRSTRWNSAKHVSLSPLCTRRPGATLALALFSGTTQVIRMTESIGTIAQDDSKPRVRKVRVRSPPRAKTLSTDTFFSLMDRVSTIECFTPPVSDYTTRIG